MARFAKPCIALVTIHASLFRSCFASVGAADLPVYAHLVASSPARSDASVVHPGR
jgi:hypothetical protein